jgi:hypothetical protein
MIVIVPSYMPDIITRLEKIAILPPFRIKHDKNTYIPEDLQFQKINGIGYPHWEYSIAILVSGKPTKFIPNGLHAEERFTPDTLKKAMNSSESEQWKFAMKDELDAMRVNDVWDVVDRPKDRKVIGSKYVYKIKENPDGSINKYKARLVAQGFSQIEGVDFEESFAPVIKHIALRTCLALANSLNFELHQMDVNNAFLYGEIEEETFMELPPDCRVDSNKVCKLKRSIYGLKVSPLMWYKRLDKFLTKAGFHRLSADHCIYVKGEQENQFILVYVDDSVLGMKTSTDIKKHKEIFSKEFKMKDLGEVKVILGWEIERDRKKKILKINQTKFIKDTLRIFGMSECSSEKIPMDVKVHLTEKMNAKGNEMENVPYRQAIGKLNYLVTGTRPDIANAVNIVSRFQQNPGPSHWTAVKRILRYVKGTLSVGLTFDGNLESKSLGLCGYTDSDWAADHDRRKSTSGTLVMGFGGILIWSSKRQNCVALSTAEAEFVAACECVKNIQYLRNLLNEMKIIVPRTIQVYEDNQGAIAMINNPTSHSRAKHIDIKYHFIRDLVNLKLIKLKYISTKDQLADILTKPLDSTIFNHLRSLLKL